MFGIIRTSRPNWILAENVAGHVTLGLDEVLADLESEGYAVQPIIVPACAVDASHRRDRVWIIATALNEGRSQAFDKYGIFQKANENRAYAYVCDWDYRREDEIGTSWKSNSGIRRVDDGIPKRVDRLRGLGNAIVPQVAYEIIKSMIKADESA